ncbi:MAG: phenylacetate--CoA ligase [Candidatus Omnitrophica bacterium]|nr:phenylacetate--CoA ligase [Candidatus Omnitrophota bacterium]
MIWNEKIELLSRDGLKKIQTNSLKKMLKVLYSNSSFYKKKIDEKGIKISEIKTIDDIGKLPFTDKDDIRDNYPFGLFNSPLEEIREIHVSSGTTGHPTVVGYTDDDLQLWSEVMARALCCAGANKGDMIQVSYGYGLFTGGLGLHYGATKMGLTILPMSSGQTKRQLQLMQDFKPKILACTPSYALFLADEAKKMGIDPSKSSWEIGVFGAEPWSKNMRDKIEKMLGLTATDIYGLSEIIGPGVAQECTYKDGLHIFSDVFYPEILDIATGEAVKDGEYGELVITTLNKTGMPLLRYKTRDIVKMTTEICKCGRIMPRISKVKGRTDDMIIVRGINVFPSQIEHVLLNMDETHPHYQIIVTREDNGLDNIEVLVEIKQELFSDEIKVMEVLSSKIKNNIQANLGVGVKVRLVEPATLERSEGKSVRVIDKRTL